MKERAKDFLHGAVALFCLAALFAVPVVGAWLLANYFWFTAIPAAVFLCVAVGNDVRRPLALQEIRRLRGTK